MKSLKRILACALLCIAGIAGARAGAPTTLRAPPGLLDKVGIEQMPGAQVPLDTVFRDTGGHELRLGDLLQGKPTLLVPGYYGCQNLCSVVRAGVAHAVARSGLQPGKQFNVVLVSIDPQETSTTAATARTNDATLYPDAGVSRWHYLTGTGAASADLMRDIGFHYLYDPRNGQYDHDAGVVLLSPQGRVTQYLFGVKFAPETLRLALVDASQGRIGNIVDHFLLLCCDYDPSTGRYSLVIHRVMQVLCVATVLTLVALILLLRRIERRRRREQGR